VSATGQAILHEKAIEKSRKLSQQTWVTVLQRNTGEKNHNGAQSWTWKGNTASKKHWTQISVRRDEEDNGIAKDKQASRPLWLRWEGRWICVGATATDRIGAGGRDEEL